MKQFGNRTLDIFQEINMIPRNSEKEKAVSDYIKAWAENLSLEVYQDDMSNLIIRKPATAGYENSPSVMLQAHMDMVCEKMPDSTHNFNTDPIILKCEGDWVDSAVGTSIGADNAIGVATCMRILENNELEHPALEMVFTVREETDFMGAAMIDGNQIRSRMMINLDFEDDTSLIAGSCGGCGIKKTLPLKRVASKDEKAYEVKLSGLIGGHSGEDIHRGRGNAIVMLARLIKKSGFKLASIDGGSNRLAISRDAVAVVYAPADSDVAGFFDVAGADMRRELGRNGAEFKMETKVAEKAYMPLDDASAKAAYTAIFLSPNGPLELCADFDGVIENSCNLGIVETKENELVLVSEARGQHTSAYEFTKEKEIHLADMLGAELEFFTEYSPWEYAEESRLRETALETYRQMNGSEMNELVLHAGLEVGEFVAKFDDLDVIAIGPLCENLHAPTERVSISSCEKHYEYLITLLANLK